MILRKAIYNIKQHSVLKAKSDLQKGFFLLLGNKNLKGQELSAAEGNA